MDLAGLTIELMGGINYRLLRYTYWREKLCSQMSLTVHWKDHRIQSIVVWDHSKQNINKKFSLNSNISLCRIRLLNIEFVSLPNTCVWILENDWNSWRSFSNFSIRLVRSSGYRVCSCSEQRCDESDHFKPHLHYYVFRFEWYWRFQSVWGIVDALLSFMIFSMTMTCQCHLHHLETFVLTAFIYHVKVPM